jgi:hypothetical protein
LRVAKKRAIPGHQSAGQGKSGVRATLSVDRDLVCRLSATAILSVENALMTHGIIRYFLSDMAAFVMRQRLLFLRVQLLLSVFSVLLLLTSPMAHLWHIQSEYTDP